MRISGREAITLLVESDLNLKKFTEEEEKELRKSVASYALWWMEPNDFSRGTGVPVKRNKTRTEAIELVKNLYNADKRLLSETDPYADHIWSRGQEVGDTEIDPANATENNFELASNTEFESYQGYWDRMEFIADKNAEGYDSNYWFRSERKYLKILDYINRIKPNFSNENPAHLALARKVKAKVNELRFGRSEVVGGVKYTRGGGELTHRHWATCFNVLNEMLGIEKRIVLKDNKKEDDQEDAMENALYIGLDHSKYEESSEEASTEE